MPPTVYRDVQRSSMIMQLQYESDGTSHETERWELHGNISQNGYENAIVGRYGGCFLGINLVGLCTGENCAALERLAMVEGESASIPWAHISHEELIYLLRKFLLVIETKC
ncbi:hypothetical protein D1007_56088 [Hordeum vulgare]|nr:hypothetical protein D1007_56088 [Hordeum vulgare]